MCKSTVKVLEALDKTFVKTQSGTTKVILRNTVDLKKKLTYYSVFTGDKSMLSCNTVRTKGKECLL